MKNFSKSLLTELDNKLKTVHSENEEPIKYAEESIKILIVILERLKTFFISYKFENKSEEIEFFKLIKPQFVYKLIYYNEIYNIETNSPYGGEKVLRKFYNSELEKLKIYFEENLDFYKYYRTGNNYLDKKYFVRGQHDIRLTLDSFYFQADHRFTTSHDFKVAQIMANDLVQVFIETEIARIERRSVVALSNINAKNAYKWTGSRVALIELIYALHAEGVFNNGTSDLKDIAGFFESTFHVELGQFHRAFLEMRIRTERTKFLNSLRETLVKRMDEVDD